MECNFCKNTFSTKGNLAVHQKKSKYCLALQDKKPDKVFMCKYCDKEFTLKYSYVDHIKMHESNPLLITYYEEIQVQKESIKNLRDTISILQTNISELRDEASYHRTQNERLISQHEIEIRHYQIQNQKLMAKTLNRMMPHVDDENKIVHCQNIVNEEHINKIIEDMNLFYNSLDVEFKIGIDLDQFRNKDSLYIGIFKPTDEFIRENAFNLDFGNRVFFKFGVSGEVVSRNDWHYRDDVFIDYVTVKVFMYQNFEGRSNAEKRLKHILRNMKLKINYYRKNEIFLSTIENFNTVVRYMTEHNEKSNKNFSDKFIGNVENDKDVVLEKIRLEKTRLENEKAKNRDITELMKNGNITFEQFKELVVE
jgi:hypothetical protein